MIYNLISLIWLCLNKISSLISAKVWLNTKFLFGSTPVILCNPWNQHFSSNYKCYFSLLSSYEPVKSKSSLYHISNSVVQGCKYLLCFNLVFVKLSFTSFLDSIGRPILFNLPILVVINSFITIRLVVVFITMWCWVAFLWESEAFHISPFFFICAKLFIENPKHFEKMEFLVR